MFEMSLLLLKLMNVNRFELAPDQLSLLNRAGTCFVNNPNTDEACDVGVLRDVRLSVEGFSIETTQDRLYVNGRQYTGTSSSPSTGPNGVIVSGGSYPITWSGASDRYHRVSICAGEVTLPLFEVTSSYPSSACTVTNDGLCFTDGLGDYGSNERCTIEVGCFCLWLRLTSAPRLWCMPVCPPRITVFITKPLMILSLL
jgi:hypothetical protein